MKRHTQIFLGMLAGAAVGGIARIPAAAPLQSIVIALTPAGIVFIRLITMVVVPLVVASLFVGVASLGDVRRLGRIGGKTLAYFLITTLVAAAIGLVTARLAHLGETVDPGVRAMLTSGSEADGVQPSRTNAASGLSDAIVGMIPQNPFAAAAQTDLLPLIVAVCIFGAAAATVKSDGQRTLVAFFQGVGELSMIVIDWLMRLAPAAVFVLIASLVAQSGLGLLESLFVYALVVVLALAIHVCTTLFLALRFGARLGVVTFFQAVSDAVLLAFSTAASNVALPVSMAAARNRLGISNEIVGFVLPVGTTLNKNGAAIYKTVTAVFIAQLYGIHLGPAQMIAIVLTATVAAFAGAGVPGSSLVTTLIVLNAIGLGPRASAAIALVTGIDRPLDMCRTTVNTLGNLVGTAWIARSEREMHVPRSGQ